MALTKTWQYPIVLAAGFAATTAFAAGGAPEWSYEGSNGPEYWGDLLPDWAACSNGTEQSPINLTGARRGRADDLKLYWNKNAEWEVENNGHTIELGATDAGYATLGGKKFDLLQFHFHTPSEHAIKSERSEMEVHFVHRADDGLLAVLGVMMEIGRRNGGNSGGRDLFSRIMAVAPEEKSEHGIELEHVNPNDLLPAANQGSDFYRYAGSLTTPGCNEIVTWTVLEKPITVKKPAVETFQDIFPMNARPLQDLNGREITKRGGGRD